MKFLKKILDDNRKSAELRDERVADFKAWLEADRQDFAARLKASTDAQMEKTQRNHDARVNEIHSEFIDKQKIDIEQTYIQAIDAITTMWDMQIQRNEERNARFPEMQRHTVSIDWSPAYLKGFLMMKNITFLANKFKSMWIDLPQEIIDNITEKRQELRQRYFDKTQELISKWYEFIIKLDESDFE